MLRATMLVAVSSFFVIAPATSQSQYPSEEVGKAGFLSSIERCFPNVVVNIMSFSKTNSIVAGPNSFQMYFNATIEWPNGWMRPGERSVGGANADMLLFVFNQKGFHFAGGGKQSPWERVAMEGGSVLICTKTERGWQCGEQFC